MEFLIISGFSGAGKSLALKYLEDMGVYCVDNIPPALIPKFVAICRQSSDKFEKVAMVTDVRGGNMFDEIIPALDELKEEGIHFKILFLESSDEAIVKRYKESRRSHPLSLSENPVKGIAREREILQVIKERADFILDTSRMSPKELKQDLLNILSTENESIGILINIVSFGFKYGIPIDCDLVFDVRFIPNPYYISRMKKLTGLNEPVKQYVMGHEETKGFLTRIDDMIDYLMPLYIREGKSQLVIGIGCTGGKHRSVVIAEHLCEKLISENPRVFIEHRDIDKKSKE